MEAMCQGCISVDWWRFILATRISLDQLIRALESYHQHHGVDWRRHFHTMTSHNWETEQRQHTTLIQTFYTAWPWASGTQIPDIFLIDHCFKSRRSSLVIDTEPYFCRTELCSAKMGERVWQMRPISAECSVRFGFFRTCSRFTKLWWALTTG